MHLLLFSMGLETGCAKTRAMVKLPILRPSISVDTARKQKLGLASVRGDISIGTVLRYTSSMASRKV
jgi:hypothetical protein